MMLEPVTWGYELAMAGKVFVLRTEAEQKLTVESYRREKAESRGGPVAPGTVALQAEVERLQNLLQQEREWRDRAVASCAANRCASRDRRLRDAGVELDAFRALAAEARALDEVVVPMTALAINEHRAACAQIVERLAALAPV